jgi:hypothetical protein
MVNPSQISLRTTPNFTETENSLLSSEKPGNGTHFESDEFSPLPHSEFISGLL